MANITKRTNKACQTSYRLRVYIGEDVNGKQLYQSMTWTPPVGMRPTTAEKEAAKQAVLFEERVQQGIVSLDGKTRFVDYAEQWMKTAELAPKTREQYEYLLKRINTAIGHIPLEKLRAEHLEAFYSNLREEGVKERGGYAIATTLAEKRKDAGLTLDELGRLSGISAATVGAACQGKRISTESAKKIAEVLQQSPDTLFELHKGSGKLSDKTIRHYHTVIRAILESAKKKRIVPYNVAAEHMNAPKMARTEARYLTDEEAQSFLAALMEEPDIRVKTALALNLFTGVRRGELCGLEWPDIDTKDDIIHIRRASQYIAGKGVIEVPTKNDSSTRDIEVSDFVIGLLAEYRQWWVQHRLKWGAEWQGDKERLFIKDNGAPIFPDTINRWLNKFLKSNSLPKITPHSLRHTFATLQITSGVDLRTLQARTGHAQASTLLNTYSHAIKSAQSRAAAVLDDVLLKDIKHG